MSDRTDKIAAAIDRITATLGPIAAKFDKKEGHLPTAMALCLLAAHSLIHDGASEEDLVQMARAAWAKSVTVHNRDCTKR